MTLELLGDWWFLPILVQAILLFSIIKLCDSTILNSDR
ncbi:MAG: hypothetical protein JWP89_3460 [Schlesneria sp.]|nr:hypothetical protein [Schlesneria sp.]